MRDGGSFAGCWPTRVSPTWLLLFVFTFSPRPAGTALPAVVRVDLVAAAPATAKPAPASQGQAQAGQAQEDRASRAAQAPKPKAKPKPVAKPKPAAKPEPAAEPQVEYDDLMAKLREEAGEAKEPRRGGRCGQRAPGRWTGDPGHAPR